MGIDHHDFDHRDPDPIRVPNFRGGIPGWVLALLGVLGGALASGVPVIVYIARMPDGPQWQEMSKALAKVQADQEVAKQHEIDTTANINLQFENLRLLIKQTPETRRK
jgi:hypothetical protein